MQDISEFNGSDYFLQAISLYPSDTAYPATRGTAKIVLLFFSVFHGKLNQYNCFIIGILLGLNSINDIFNYTPARHAEISFDL
jgi:hypothetical protein